MRRWLTVLVAVLAALAFANAPDPRIFPLTERGGSVWQSQFDATNRLTGMNFGNGAATTFGYYKVSKWLNQMTTTSAAGTIQNFTNRFDALGSVIGIQDLVAGHTDWASATMTNTTYDDLNRLIGAAWAGYGQKSYAYDTVGNMATNGEFGTGGYVYGAIRPHCVRSANGAWYTYDQNGNVVFRTGQRLDYDVNNRLWRAISTSGVTTMFGYDANGARLWEQSGTNALQVWVGSHYEEKQDQVLYHILVGGKLVCTFDATGTNVFQFYHPDYLTSTSIQTDQGGNQIQHYEYTAFGQTRYTGSSTAFPVSRRYTSQVLDDATGLYYYNFRYYDPQLARFIQPDDIIGDLADPQSYNRYSYVLNNPLRFTDPGGHSGKEVADWWSSKVGTAFEFYTAGSQSTILIGTLGTLNSLVGGVADPLRLGGDAGRVSAEGGGVGTIALTTVQEGGRALAVVPVGKVLGEGAGKLASSLLQRGEKEAAGELAGALGGCFVAGTLVPTESGNVEIQSVKVGDRVWSYSFQTAEWGLREVEATSVHDYAGDVITLRVGEAVIEATGNHPFWVVSGDELGSRPPAQDVPAEGRAASPLGRWVEARSLEHGDELLLLGGRGTFVTGSFQREEHLPVYNLRVEGNHTYAVSQDGALVHNKAAQVKPIAGQGSMAREAAENLRGMDLGDVDLAGASYNTGRKALEKAGFQLEKTTETGRRIFRNPDTGATVTYDSGKALTAGQKPHWTIQDKAGTYFDRSGRAVTAPSPAMGGKHIPGD